MIYSRVLVLARAFSLSMTSHEQETEIIGLLMTRSAEFKEEGIKVIDNVFTSVGYSQLKHY